MHRGRLGDDSSGRHASWHGCACPVSGTDRKGSPEGFRESDFHEADRRVCPVPLQHAILKRRRSFHGLPCLSVLIIDLIPVPELAHSADQIPGLHADRHFWLAEAPECHAVYELFNEILFLCFISDVSRRFSLAVIPVCQLRSCTVQAAASEIQPVILLLPGERGVIACLIPYLHAQCIMSLCLEPQGKPVHTVLEGSAQVFRKLRPGLPVQAVHLPAGHLSATDIRRFQPETGSLHIQVRLGHSQLQCEEFPALVIILLPADFLTLCVQPAERHLRCSPVNDNHRAHIEALCHSRVSQALQNIPGSIRKGSQSGRCVIAPGSGLRPGADLEPVDSLLRQQILPPVQPISFILSRGRRKRAPKLRICSQPSVLFQLQMHPVLYIGKIPL